MGAGGAATRMVRGSLARSALVLVLAFGAGWGWTASAWGRNQLNVIPFPGTPDASRASQILFPALKRSDLTGLGVVGSTSGVHRGHLVTLPGDSGTAFVPDDPFTPGELVRVTAYLRTAQAGAASGDPGSSMLSWSFAVAVAESASSKPASDRSARRGAGAAGGLVQSFHSQPGLHPPPLGLTRDRDTSSGDIFLAPIHTPQPGPMIVDGQGRLIWFEPRSQPTYNLEVASYRGQPVLTWWQGQWLGAGEDVIMNRSYRTVAVVHAGEGYSSDLHEFQVTPQGTALVDIYSPVRANLSGIGGSAAGKVLDCIVQEVDIRTGRVLWEWHALGHVPLNASHTGPPSASSAYDFFHINSIQQLPDGNFLVSSRSDWALYEISRRTGNVIWTLGGNHSSFKMGPGTSFEWQHDAHLNPDGTLTLFNDAGSPQEEPQSSAKLLRVNTQTMTVTLVHSFTHSPKALAALAGSMQELPNHNVLVAWGNEPLFSEFTPSGQPVFDGRFPFGTYSYRAYRFPWSARPVTRPALATVATSGGRTTLYASWNGATNVAFWRVLAGGSAHTLAPLGSVSRWTGFETRITRSIHQRYWAVQALNAHRRVLRTSRVVAMPSGG